MSRKFWCAECGMRCEGLECPSCKGMTQPAYDNVNHPAHYKQGDIECIDAIKAALTPEEFRGYLKGNIIKYTWRERMKGNIESLKKAAWYLRRLTNDAV